LPLFSYSGFDGTGRKASGQIEAAGRNAALLRLREKGVFPSELTEEGTTGTRSGRRFWQRRVSGGDLAVAVRQMATLLGAGLTLDEVLGTVADQIENPRLTQALIRAREEVVQGSALYAALEEQGTVFPETDIGLENFLTDGNIFLLQTPTDSGVNRYVWVAKMRKQNIDTDIFPMELGQGGMKVHQNASAFSMMSEEDSPI